MRTLCETQDPELKVEVDDSGGYVELNAHQALGILHLTPPQARMLARVIRGTADEIDRRLR